MGYYIINKQSVFIFNKHVRMFDEELFKDKDDEWISGSTFEGADFLEREKRIINYLKQISKSSPGNFYLNWAWFDVKKDSGINIYELFISYCHFYNYPFFFSKESERYDYDPIVDKFSINYSENAWGGFLSMFKKKNAIKIKVIIDPMRINRIVGTLENFIVYSKDYKLVCGKDFNIFPLNDSVSAEIDTEEKEWYEALIKGIAKGAEVLNKCAPRQIID